MSHTAALLELCLFFVLMALCKYGDSCTRANCTFSHKRPKQARSASNARTNPCRYGSKCNRDNCSFMHADGRPPRTDPPRTACRYGANCTRDTCSFWHPVQNQSYRPCVVKLGKMASFLSHAMLRLAVELNLSDDINAAESRAEQVLRASETFAAMVEEMRLTSR